MPSRPPITDLRLINGSTGDPCLWMDCAAAHDAVMIDAGDNYTLTLEQLGDLRAVFITHHHVDHFIGFDRVVRANMSNDKTLHVFGPPGTIQKTHDRITSYEYQYFPFQRISLMVRDIHDDHMEAARFECQKRFVKPRARRLKRPTARIYEDDDFAVDAAAADHTVACLAFAVSRHTDAGIRRIAYVTDTAWTDNCREGLTGLARNADRLYCDSYYSAAQRVQAARHKHMTAADAAELACAAGVRELRLMHFAPRYRGRYGALLAEARRTFANVEAEGILGDTM